ncbi:MAG: Maf family protein [Anaerolineae bacterium]|nr:Maf family protein [Anaerolineae bacterium]
MLYTDSGIRRLILASGSPRRRQLLSLLGIPFVIKAAGVDERPLPGEPPSEMVLRVAHAKAFAIGEVRPDELVIAADTVVVLDGQLLGKPKDADDAIRILCDLRGRPHMVYSGVAVWHSARRRMLTELAESMVWMRHYSEEEVRAYVASGDPLDKAGAYAIQHPGFDPVARVEGCWLNVMGLPLCHLARALDRVGVVVPASVPGACLAFNQRACTIPVDTLKARR